MRTKKCYIRGLVKQIHSFQGVQEKNKTLRNSLEFYMFDVITDCIM